MTAAATPAASIDAFGLTDAGRVRRSNEDHFAIATLRKAIELMQCSIGDGSAFDRYRGPDAMVFVVADGVGGQPGGAFASETAIATLVEYLGQAAGCFHNLDVSREHEFLDQLERSVLTAHERLTRGDAAPGGPATTLTLVTLVWPRAYIVHVGDSRAFYLRRGRLRQLTRDQSMGEFMVESGAWTDDQARRARTSGVLMSAVGGSEMTPAIGLVDLAPGDTLLLCTDGLTKHVPDDRIAELLGRAQTAEAAARELVAAALADGGTDNVTAIVARMAPALSTT
jgi:serine/threonine protein phosphatase PrpC